MNLVLAIICAILWLQSRYPENCFGFNSERNFKPGVLAQACNPNTQKIDRQFKANLGTQDFGQLRLCLKIQESRNSQRHAPVLFSLVISCWFCSCLKVCEGLNALALDKFSFKKMFQKKKIKGVLCLEGNRVFIISDKISPLFIYVCFPLVYRHLYLILRLLENRHCLAFEQIQHCTLFQFPNFHIPD